MKRIRKPALVICLGVVLYLIATNVGAGWLYVVSAIIASTVAVSALAPWWNVRTIETIRRVPVLATTSEPFECTLEVRNTGWLARYLLEVEDRFAGDTGRAVVVQAGSDKPEVTRYTIEDPRRGVYTGGSITLESGVPFGLFYRRRSAWVASEIVVYPKTFEVAGLPPSVVVDAEQGDMSESSTLHRGHGGEFWGVREYRPGDPARLIAWKRSARGLLAGKLALVELAQETHPPLVLALNLDPRAPREAREMVVSAGASLLLYGLREGREVRADAGPQRMPFPEEVTPESILTWCAGLQACRPPDPEGASVEIRSSVKNTATANTARRMRSSESSGVSKAQVVVLVSCHAFAGAGHWMSLQEEEEFVSETETSGQRVARLGPEVEEPWRIP